MEFLPSPSAVDPLAWLRLYIIGLLGLTDTIKTMTPTQPRVYALPDFILPCLR